MRTTVPLRWVGGKTRLLPVLHQYLPKTCNNYFEPFFGGGALFFDYGYKAEKQFISDINDPLMITYTSLAHAREYVFNHLTNELQFQSYDNIKAWFNSKKNLPRGNHFNYPKFAAAFIALNHLCFNGLYRENKRGEFNAPVGRDSKGAVRTLSTLNYDKLKSAGTKLENACIVSRSFDPWPFDQTPTKGDVVFYDPAYLDEFSSYHESGFGPEQHKILQQQAESFATSGATVIVCGSNNQASRDIYGEPTRVVELQRTVGASNRKKAEEALWVWNASK